MFQRVTGLVPNRPETRELYAATREFRATSASLATVLQAVPYVRNQRAKPSCVGHALAACVDASLQDEPWCSAVDLWVDARRRQGRIERSDEGTRIEYALESLLERGWNMQRQSEDMRPAAQDRELPSLDAELEAFDNRMRGARHYSIQADRKQSVIDAIHRGFGVVFGAGVREGYSTPSFDAVLGLSAIGPRGSGHAQRIAGYCAERDAFLVQNSWGPAWGGCLWSDGQRLPGCILVRPEVLDVAWDIEALEVIAK